MLIFLLIAWFSAFLFYQFIWDIISLFPSLRRAQLWTKPINLNKKNDWQKIRKFQSFHFHQAPPSASSISSDGSSWDFFKIKFLSHFFSLTSSLSLFHPHTFFLNLSLSLCIVYSLSFLFEVKFRKCVLFKNPFSASNHLKRKWHNFFFRRRRALSLSPPLSLSVSLSLFHSPFKYFSS